MKINHRGPDRPAFLVKRRKNWSREEEFELFSELQVLEKDLYTHVFSFLPIADFLTTKLETFVKEERSTDDTATDKIEEDLARLHVLFQSESPSKAKLEAAIDSATDGFKGFLAPRKWVFFIRKEFMNLNYLAMQNFKLDPSSAEFLSWASTLETKAVKIANMKADFAHDNVGLVGKIVRQRSATLVNLPKADLFQDGVFGVLKSIDKFDHTVGVKFSTYATWWVRHEISRAIQDKDRMVRIPVHVHEKIYQLSSARRELERELAREATVDELAEKSGLPVKSVMMILSQRKTFSLDEPVANADGDADRDKYSYLEDPDAVDPCEVMHDRQVKKEVREALQSLTDRERTVLFERFGLAGAGEPSTLADIGRRYNLSRERIRQIENIALKRLRQVVSPDLLQTANA